ncbi:hypothetical protein AXG93_2381s1140 [Marchantia polymorpha subsp. ruderalis]|uniref:Uncharacterized protein n=1 Tax=Marchantia polymorpha subsp. ruderalis TaxID=1480154 RepID=A0A176VNC3_MARPO|nr:hypothetical protein AXG93_2381s1140 [Marchantia polymorpha subsp. ruderalis]
MKFLPARPTIDRERIVLGVCMMDNRNGLFCLVSSIGQVYVPARVLLDPVVSLAESYDVLVGGAVLYPMGFWMDYWTEIAAYRPGWQSGDGRLSELPVRFISRDRPLESTSVALTSVVGFIGVLTWSDDLLEGNMSTDDTLVYEEVEEIRDPTLTVDSILDVSRHSQVVRVADRSPMVLVNRIGKPQMALPTLVS